MEESKLHDRSISAHLENVMEWDQSNAAHMHREHILYASMTYIHCMNCIWSILLLISQEPLAAH